MKSKLDKRRQLILSILADVPISSTQKLAEATNVSNETIRKDLDALADEGRIIKVHGGVALAGDNINEIPFDLRAATNIDLKKRIAGQAVLLIQPEDTILLESCTTNLELAKKLLQDPGLTDTLIIITNSFSIATALEYGNKCKRMFFLGGWVNARQYSALGHKTAKMLTDFHVSKSFISGAALSNQFVLSGYYDDDVEFQKNALTAAQETILMIDSSKFSQTTIFTVAPLSQFDYLITDKALDKGEKAYLAEHKIDYIKA